MTDRVIHAVDLDGTRALAEDGAKAYVKIDAKTIKFNASGQLVAQVPTTTTAAADPTAPGAMDGDEWLVLSNGVITKQWIWDTETTSWYARPVGSAFKHLKEWHVDPNGNDTTGTGAEDSPFKTLAKAASVAGSTGEKIVVHPGTYTENVVFTQQNLDVVGEEGTVSGTCYVNGTLTFSGTSSSSRLAGIMADNVIHSGAGAFYMDRAKAKTTFVKSGNGYFEGFHAETNGVSITGSGQAVFNGGTQAVVTVNNAAAVVTVNDSLSLAVVTATAGSLVINESSVFAASTGGTAINAATGTNVIIKNSQIYDPTGAPAKVTLSGSYSLGDVYFAKSTSTLGTNMGQVAWFDDIGLINVPTITTATKMLVRDANGVVSEQLLPTSSGGGNVTVQANSTTKPTGAVKGDELIVTSTGTATGTVKEQWIYSGTDWIKRPSASTEAAPSLPAAIAIGTKAQLDALVDKVPNGYYIQTDGANKGDIMKWADTDGDSVGDTWQVHIVPTNQLEWTVLTNATGEPAGKYTYDLATDAWIKVTDLEPLIPSVDDPVAVGGIKMIGRYLAPYSYNSATYILGDSVAGHGRSISHATDNGSIVAPTGAESIVRKSPFTWYQVDTPYSELSKRDAWATDAQFNTAGSVAIDDLGILYYKGTAAFMLAMTGTDTGVSTAITSAYVPDKFWANRAVKVVKFWLSYNTNNLIAQAGDGTLWVRGVAGASGVYGDGVVVADKVWHKVNVPAKAWKKIYITRDGLSAGALSTDGYFYAWGDNTAYRIVGSTSTTITAPTSPGLVPRPVTDFAMDENSTMLISGGARYATGTNNSGKFGNGGTTAATAYFAQPSNGFTFDKVFSADDGGNTPVYYYITTDKKAVMTGYNTGSFASSVAAGNVTTPTLMGTGAYQGTVIDIRAYAHATLIHTNQGTVWTAVDQTGSNAGSHGWGINITTGINVGLNVFKQVPVRGLVVGVQTSQSGANPVQMTVLTDAGLIYSWGSAEHAFGPAEVVYAPAEIPTQMYRQQTPKVNSQVDLLSLTASLTTLSAGVATQIIDGVNGQTVTFTVPYTGAAGMLSTTGWTINGANVTVSNIQNPIYVLSASGSLTFTATVNAADISALVAPNTQAQTYTLNTGSLTSTITGVRGTDAIAGGLTTSLSAYNAAAAGAYVPITNAEYAAIQTSVAGAVKGGQQDSPTLYTSLVDRQELGFGFTATTTATAEAAGVTKAIPANNWVYAFSHKTGSAQTNRTNYLSLGPKGANTAFASVLPGITGVSNTLGEIKCYVIKGGKQVTVNTDMAILGGSTGEASIASHQTYYVGSGGAGQAPVTTTTFPTNWSTNAVFMNILSTPTKQW